MSNGKRFLRFVSFFFLVSLLLLHRLIFYISVDISLAPSPIGFLCAFAKFRLFHLVVLFLLKCHWSTDFCAVLILRLLMKRSFSMELNNAFFAMIIEKILLNANLCTNHLSSRQTVVKIPHAYAGNTKKVEINRLIDRYTEIRLKK